VKVAIGIGVEIKHMHLPFRTITCLTAVIGPAATAIAQPAVPIQQMVVTPWEQVKFSPIDPAKPGGIQIAVAEGDPASGPSSMYLKYQRGVNAAHVHSSDYRLVVLQGTMKHWGKGQDEVTAKPLSPGGSWFQPGGRSHTDACLTDVCVVYVVWSGKRDRRPATAQDP
jgi:hypothetical protein